MDTYVDVNCSPNKLEGARKKMKSGLATMSINIDDYATRLEIVRKYNLIENGKLNLDFDLKTKVINSEKVIVHNDVFIPVGISLGFVKTPLVSGSTTKYENIENQQIIYFNSETVFNYTQSGSVSQSKALESLYYATITFLSGGDNIIPAFPATNLKRVPEGKTDGFYQYEDGKYFMMTEFPFLNGGNDLAVKFDVPSADTASASGDPATEKTYAVLELIGFTIEKLSQAYTNMGCKIKCV